MYCLSEAQIEYILNDIRRNGVEMEDLQLNLLDHICCIVEQNLKENDDFENFYRQTVKQFYKRDLHEIEEETINLITFKNYYAMKKIMIGSGLFASLAFVFGSCFKIMYWPGANMLLLSAILIFSLVFLPLLFLLKSKEGSQRDKLILGIGTVVGVLYCLSMLWQIRHWPGTHVMWLSTLAISFFVFLPVYFFSGIQNAATKANTIVSTVLLMGFLGIQFTMTALRPSPQAKGKAYTYIESEQLLGRMQRGLSASDDKLAHDIQSTCEQMKSLVLKNEIGLVSIPGDFESRDIIIREKNRKDLFTEGKFQELLTELRSKVGIYNASKINDAANRIPIENSILDNNFAMREFCTDLFVLNNITQIQLFLINTQNTSVASK